MSDNLTPQPQSISSSQETAEQVSDLQIREITHNLEKFKQVLLYVLYKVGERKNVGKTVCISYCISLILIITKSMKRI